MKAKTETAGPHLALHNEQVCSCISKPKKLNLKSFYIYIYIYIYIYKSVH